MFENGAHEMQYCFDCRYLHNGMANFLEARTLLIEFQIEKTTTETDVYYSTTTDEET